MSSETVPHYFFNIGASDYVFKALRLATYNDGYLFFADENSSTIHDKFYPLIVCNSYEKLLNQGFQIPREFVIETQFRLAPKNKSDPTVNFTCELLDVVPQERLENIKKLVPEGVSTEEFRDWCAGAFRRYLFLDEHVHGSSGLMDLKAANRNAETWFNNWFARPKNIQECDRNKKWFISRFSKEIKPEVDDPLGHQRHLWELIFSNNFTNIQSIFYSESGPNVLKVAQCGTKKLEEFIKNVPEFKGSTIKYLSPIGKLNILLIDDDAEVVCEEIKGKSSMNGDALFSLDNIFNFEPLNLIASNDLLNNAIKKIKEIKSQKSHDLILLDLCLADEVGNDLSGYHLLSLLHRFLPNTPIVVYSQFDDMGHIVRAFEAGAKWFLKKGEEEKLPRHLLSILAHQNWQREWNTLKKWYEFHPLSFKDELFTEKFVKKTQWCYLVAKSLDYLPGRDIAIKKFGDGFSTAVTFSAQKGIKYNHKFLQSQVIIKIDTEYNTLMEYERYQRFIRPYIANNSGRVESPELVLDKNNSAIVYTFIGHIDQARKFDSMKNMLAETICFSDSCDYETYRNAFDILFDQILPSIHQVAPEREFCDSNNSAADKDKKQYTALSDFPNQTFGEELEASYLNNYLLRMPALEKQTVTSLNNIGTSDIAQSVIVHKVKDDYTIEVVKEDGLLNNKFKQKWVTVLDGKLINHVARYRPHIYPGMSLNVCFEEGKGDNFESLLIKKIENQKFDIDLTGAANSQAKIKLHELIELSKKLSNCFNENLPNVIIYTNDKASGNNGTEDTQSQKAAELLKENINYWLEISNDKLFDATCPVGIVHGDLNYGNIMLELRKHPPQDHEPDKIFNLTDVWLIDFAKTRRDVIAHDYNVLFTATVASLFQKDVLTTNKEYFIKLNSIFSFFTCQALFNKSDNIPDIIAEDKRLKLIYRILRRIRQAALHEGIPEDAYILTSALSCLYSFKIYLKHDENPCAAAGLIATAFLCRQEVEKIIKKRQEES